MALRIATVNAGGWRRKRHHIINFLNTDNIHILAVSETKANPKESFNIPGFTVHRRDSPLQRQLRGNAIITHNSFACTPCPLPPNFDHIEYCSVKIHLPTGPIQIISIYNPPESTLSYDLLDHISTLPRTIALGDYNSRHTSFGDHALNPNGIILSDALITLPLIRIPNSLPTFIGARGTSIPDHILHTEDLSLLMDDNCSIGTTITSDHLPLVTNTTITNPPRPAPTSTTIRDFKNTNWTDFKNYITQNLHQHPQLNTPHDIDTAVDDYTNTIQQAILTHVPTKRIHFERKPLPTEIVQLIKLKRQLYRLFNRNHDPLVKTQWNKLNATIRLKINKIKEQEWNNACSTLDYRDGKQFWDKLKVLTGTKRHTHSHLQDGNIITNDPQTKADIFARTLERTHTINNDPTYSERRRRRIENSTLDTLANYQHQPRPNHPLLNEITIDDIQNTLKKLKNTAPGTDNINNLTLKHLPPTALQLLTQIFNSILSTGHYPSTWKTTKITMIPKPGKDPSNPLSYRPISLISTTGKLLERILAGRLRNFCEENNLLPNTQYGFRQQLSTTDALFRLKTEVTGALNRAECVLAIFLDIERAFDTVWHAGLLHKLINLNIPLPFVSLIRSYLTNRISRTYIQGKLSRPFIPSAGVPQGSVIAPLLYIIYCRDLPQPHNPKISLSQYADDTAYWVRAHSTNLCNRHMTRQINTLEKWLRDWRVKPNPHKTQLILFLHPFLSRKTTFSLDNISLSLWRTPLTLSTKITYLGVTLTKTLNDNTDITNTLNKCRQRASILSAIKGRIHGCHPKTLAHTYKTFIRPLIEYRAILLATTPNYLSIQFTRFERKILRKIHGLHYRHPNNTIYQITNFTPITTRLPQLQAKYIHRTINHQNPITTAPLTAPTHIPVRPRKKIPFPPAHLLQITDNLPDNLQHYLDNMPLKLRQQQ